jgi:hypothetical protein
MRSSVRIILVCATVLLLTGCVWLRLLDLKNQFGDFDRHITVPDGPGIELRFRHPVLLAEDLTTLIRGEPTATAHVGNITVLSYAFSHVPSPDGPDPVGVTPALIITVTVIGGRVTAIGLPPEVFRVVPRSIALAGMRSLGRAAVDTGKRSATAQVELGGIAEPLPNRAQLVALFGRPNNVLPVEGRERVLWRYQLNGKSLREDGKPVIGALAVAFRPGEDVPVRFQVNISGMWLYLDLPHPPVAVPGAVPRAGPQPLPTGAAPGLPAARPAGQ